MRYIKIGGAYQLTERFTIITAIQGHSVKCDQYSLSTDGTLTIEKYYTWDGASGAIDTSSVIRASCIHDVFCDLINARVLPRSLQPVVDSILVDNIADYWECRRLNGTFSQRFIANLLLPLTWLRRKYIYRAVRLYQSNKKRPFTRKEFEVM